MIVCMLDCQSNFRGTSAPLTQRGVNAACEMLDVDPQTIWTVILVETAGCGFLPDRRPVILFERHVFSEWTGGVYDEIAPTISSHIPGYYGQVGYGQYDRLILAMKLDTKAALYSASWGLGQILGYNFRSAGYTCVEDMVTEFCNSEDAQLLAMARYCHRRGLADELRRGDWTAFAFSYNGPSFHKNRYDARLNAAHRDLEEFGFPDLSVRADQMRLTFGGFAPGGVDGFCGPLTLAALERERLYLLQSHGPV